MLNLKHQDMRETPRKIMPLVNVRETDTSVELDAEMIGLTREDISVDVNADELTIRGTANAEELPKGFTALYRERVPAAYERTFVLSDAVDKDKITATYENGVLHLTLRKTEKTQPKRITVN